MLQSDVEPLFSQQRHSLAAVIADFERVDRDLGPPEKCAECTKYAAGGFWNHICWLHWLDSRLLRADDWLTDHMAVFTWARSIAVFHGPEDYEECETFATAYAKTVCRHVSEFKGGPVHGTRGASYG